MEGEMRSEQGLGRLLGAEVSAFCGQCSLHGFSYLSPARARAVRVLWAGVVVAGFALCVALGNLIWAKYDRDPTLTVVESAHFPTEEIPFAAVTVCDPQIYGPATHNISTILSLRGFNSSQLQMFYRSFEPAKEPSSAEADVERMHRLLGDLHISYSDLVRELRKPCSQLLKECMWRGQLLNCSLMFREVLTVFGYCCQFDVKHFKQFAANDTNLSGGVLPLEALDIVVDSSNSHPDGTSSDGHVMLYVFDPEKRLTLLDSPVTLRPATFYDVSIDLSLMDSSEDVESLTLEKRKCFLNTDGIKSGSYEGCFSHLLMQQIASTCQCLPFDYVPDADSAGEPRAPCTWPRLGCVRGALKHIQSKMRSIMSKGAGCYQLCDYAQYKTKAEYMKLSRRASAKSLEASYVSVHNAENICIKYRREVLYTWDQMLANLGGIFGLCLGGSIISIIEIVWFLFGVLATTLRYLLRKRSRDAKVSSKDACLRKQKTLRNGKTKFSFVH